MSKTVMSSRPVVSVLMPVRDAAAFLPEALESIRRQSFTEWELMAVDDGSLDGSREILQVAAREDARIRVCTQDRLGLVEALNRSAAEARGVYFARMDADDRSHPARLEQQIAYLEAHPEVGVLGTAVQRFGAAAGVWTRPAEDSMLRAVSLFETPFAHPTVMLRRTLWNAAAGGGYREEFRAAEDIDLWERLADYIRFANLPQVLLEYRVHAAQVTRVASGEMATNGARVRLRCLQRLGLSPDAGERALHEAVAWLRNGSAVTLAEAGVWLGRIQRANVDTPAFDPNALAHVLSGRWLELCNAHSSLGWKAWEIHRQGGARLTSAADCPRWLRFSALCALRQLTRRGEA